MRFKYYLRGCGLGILLAAVILSVGFCRNGGSKMSDEDVMKRAMELGMVKPEESQQRPAGNSENLDGNGTEAGSEPGSEPDTQAMADPEDDSQDDSQDNSQDKDEEPTENADPSGQDASEQSSSEPGSEAGNSSDEPEKVTVVVRRGEVCRQLAEDLLELGLISDADDFRKYMQETGYDNMILVGEYELTIGMEYKEIAEIITTKQE